LAAFHREVRIELDEQAKRELQDAEHLMDEGQVALVARPGNGRLADRMKQWQERVRVKFFGWEY